MFIASYTGVQQFSGYVYAGFVLIGRALEEKAKLQASADMVALQELVPTRARLALETGGYSEVPAEAVGPGDLIMVRRTSHLGASGLCGGVLIICFTTSGFQLDHDQ